MISFHENPGDIRDVQFVVAMYLTLASLGIDLRPTGFTFYGFL